MYLNNVRGAEYNRQVAKMMVVTMMAAIQAYQQHKKETQKPILKDVEDTIQRLQSDLDKLMEDINDQTHAPKNGTEYLDRAMELSNRKTGSKMLDSGNDGVASLRKKTLQAMNEFETEYKAGTDLAIDSNNALAIHIIRGMKDALAPHMSFEFQAPAYPDPHAQEQKKSFFSWTSHKKEAQPDPVDSLYQELEQLEGQIGQNQKAIAGGSERDEDRIARHQQSLKHLAKVEELSKRKTKHAEVDKKLAESVTTKSNEWKDYTSKLPLTATRYRRQSNPFDGGNNNNSSW